jgi:hypothetical protein
MSLRWIALGHSILRWWLQAARKRREGEVYFMLLKIKHIFLAVIYFKIIYCFFASSPWYKAFHIKSRNIAIKAFGLGIKSQDGASRGRRTGECGALQETNRNRAEREKSCVCIPKREKSIPGLSDFELIKFFSSPYGT